MTTYYNMYLQIYGVLSTKFSTYCKLILPYGILQAKNVKLPLLDSFMNI